jgi:hypothetical protein
LCLPTKLCMHFSFTPSVSHTLHISSFLI